VSSSESNQAQHQLLHEAVYFGTAQQLVDTTAPILRQALLQGEHVALGCTEAHNRVLAEALGNDDRIIVLPRAEVYQKAVGAVAYLRDFVQERVAAGGRRVWILGEVDFGTDGRALNEWRRYEALLNFALSAFPLSSLCGYDTAVLPDAVLVTGELTHPFLRTTGGQAPNNAHIDPAELMRLVDADDALVPMIEPAITIPEVLDFSEVHRELRTLLASEGMGRERVDDAVMAVHEVASNGLRHGEPPVTVRVWCGPGRVVCTVTDRGHGFDDPVTGYLRGGGEELPKGRFGLWLARQLCDELVTSRTPEGFTARLTVNH